MNTASNPRPYKQDARARAQQRTHETLLDAAEGELSAGRWGKVSLEAVAERAGVTKQTLLRHFGSKDGLLEAVLRRASEFVRPAAPAGDIPGCVSNLMVHYERYGDGVLRMLAEERRSSLLRKMVNRGREVHCEWVAHAFGPQLAELDDRTRERRTAQLVAVCDIYVWKVLRHDLGLDVPCTEIALTDMIERLLAPRP